MATIQAILDDVKLRYRHTFTTDQILVWMNHEQNDLFEIIEIDSAPYSFPLQTDVQFYPIPEGLDIDHIKTVTIQVTDAASDPEFMELPFKRNDDSQLVWYSELYYSIVGQTFFIPNGTKNDRQVYIYLDSHPSDITTENLNSEPNIPVRYQEILKLGVLIRIASARKDTLMRNNYDAEYQEKITDMQWKMKMSTPDFDTPIDVLPRNNNRHNHYSRRWV